jgi:hypothetical protein
MNELAIKPTGDLLGFIERASKDSTFDVNKFGMLLDRQQELLRDYRLQLFNQAFAEVQGEIGTIVKKERNPIFKNPYAKLEDLDDALRPIATSHGFTVRYTTDENWKDGWLLCRCIVAHEGGHMETTSLPGPYDLMPPGQSGRGPARSPIQAIGSTVSYLRRYTLMMAFNLVPKNNPDDDDGIRTQIRQAISEPLTVEAMLEGMRACASHNELYNFAQQHRAPSYNKLFPPDKQRVDAVYKELMEKFANEEGPSS